MSFPNEIRVANLALSYNKSKHIQIATFQNNDELASWYKSFKKIRPSNWIAKKDLPAIVLSSLVDSYYLLPERPDMAFPFLWSGINSIYNDLYISKLPASAKTVKDSDGIDAAAGLIVSVLDDEIPLGIKKFGRDKITIRDLLKEYIAKAETRNLNYAASTYLKGYAISNHNATCAPHDCIRKILISQSYKTALNKFKDLHDHICATAGTKYLANSTINENSDKTDCEIKPVNNDYSRKITHAIGEEIRTLTISANPTFFASDNVWILFIVHTFLYSSRNSAIHGNSTSRINSAHFDKDHVKSAIWTYKIGYCVLSILLYIRKDATLTDLKVLYANIASPL